MIKAFMKDYETIKDNLVKKGFQSSNLVSIDNDVQMYNFYKVEGRKFINYLAVVHYDLDTKVVDVVKFADPDASLVYNALFGDKVMYFTIDEEGEVHE